MARLKGDLTSIDLTTPFSIRPGGRIFDLSKGLNFEIIWSGSNVIDRFTGDILTGSGHTSANGPISGSQAFLVSSTGSFENLDPDLSWANDEFTLAFWVKFSDINFSSINTEPEKQFDFIAVKEKEVISEIGDINKIRFSSYVKKDANDELRAYFGLVNFTTESNPSPQTYINALFNFCDSYENLNLIKNSAKDHSISDYNVDFGPPIVFDIPYASERQTRKVDVRFNEWNHFLIRSKTRKNASPGICELWINGKLRNKYIKYYDGNEEQTQAAGEGVFEEIQLKLGGSILIPGLSSIPYPYYMKNSQDKLFISNHTFFQLSKWNRVLNDSEISALYLGTQNGVYTTRFSSISSPPRRKIQEVIGQNRLDNNKPFTDNKTILNNVGYYGLNRVKNYFDGEEIFEMSGSLNTALLQREIDNVEKSTSEVFVDYVNDTLLDCPDGTKALSLIKIDISSIENNTNLQYAGRTDSIFAKSLSSQSFSMFLSSSLFRHDRLAFEYQNLQGAFPTGIAGTGFLYYSPKRKNWIEKRNQHETSRFANQISNDVYNARNAIEINPYTVDDGNGGWLCFDDTAYTTNPGNPNRINTIASVGSNFLISSKLQTTGTSNILSQFTSSPQMAYFLNDENSLKNLGYQNIGSPTVAFGAPFSPKYHAFDDETIKLNNFIDGPFELKKAILRVPVEVQRINENVLNGYYEKYKPILYLNFEESGSAGDTVQDLTNNGNDGTLYGSASIDLSDAPTSGSTPSFERGCLDLGNSNLFADYLLINHDDSLRTQVGEEKTISLWIKGSSISDFFPGNKFFLFKGSVDGTISEYYLYSDGTSLIFIINSNTSSGYLNNYIGRRVNFATINSIVGSSFYDKWFHVAITYDGTATSNGINVYINGVQAPTSSATNGIFVTAKLASHNIYVGSRGNQPLDNFNSKIASLLYFDRLFTQNEIMAIYLNNINARRLGWNWTQNVVSRKDLDNYVFFLYRQRRSNINASFVDSDQDISSSARFLIGSASLCVYNSSSFGLAHRDGFIDYFGVDTPITSSYSSGRTRAIYLNEMFRSSSNGIDPITYENLNAVFKPLHTPAFSINTNLNNYETGSEAFRERMFVEIEINPAYVLGGYPNNSLMYVTTSKGYLSTSFLFDITSGIEQSDPYNSANANRIFNYYPQRGTLFDLENTASVPQITTIFQNVWFGGTRQPSIAIEGEYIPPNCAYSSSITSYFQFDNKKIESTANSNLQFEQYFIWNSSPEKIINLGSTAPTFDIELARTGLANYSLIEEPLKSQIGMIFDGRGKLNTFEERALPIASTVFKRTEIVNSSVEDLESSNPNTGSFSIGSLKSSSFGDVVSSLTTGYAACSRSGLRQVYNPYVLLPEDELVLGLDAGVTPPPDIAPLFGKNLYDAVDSSLGREPQKAMINPIIKNDIWHYAGNSYIRVLPGEAQLLLIGDYIKDERKIEYSKTKRSPNISVVIGENLISDKFETSEYDAYAGTYITQNFTGNIFDETRQISSDDAVRTSNSGGTIKLFKVSNNRTIRVLDQFLSGVLQ